MPPNEDPPPDLITATFYHVDGESRMRYLACVEGELSGAEHF